MSARASLPPTPPLYQQIERNHPGLLSSLFALQVRLCREVERASSAAALNKAGQSAFDTLNSFGDSIGSLSLEADEQQLLSDALDDVRIAVRGRAELRMLILEGKASEGDI